MASGTVVSDTIIVLREWLASSSFKPGARLPSERLLGRQLGIKHNAINRAMGRLMAEGVVLREGYKLFYADTQKPATTQLTCDLIVAVGSIFVKSYRKAARDMGIALRVHSYDSTTESVALLYELDKPETACVLIDPPHEPSSSVWEPALARLIRHGIPAISIRQYCANIPCVLADEAKAIELILGHLQQHGHREMAFLTVPPRAPAAMEVRSAWETWHRQMESKSSAERITFYIDDREDVRAFAQKLANEWSNVTAVVVQSVYKPVVPHLLEELARQRRNVPKDLSLICVGDLPHLATCTPRVSTAAFDIRLIQETAFYLAQRLVRKRQDVDFAHPAPCLRIEPYLILRESTAPTAEALISKTRRSGMASASLPPKADQDNSLPSSELRQNLKAMLKRPYSLTAAAEAARFASVDLAPFVNRPLHFRKGWLGDRPLTHLNAGKHLIHGVPFQVLGGAKRNDGGAIVFRSMTNETGNARTLPSRVKIPIGSGALSIYVLHGCGYARHLARFASYDFYAGTKHLGSVPLVTLGQPPPGRDDALLEQDAAKANLQDWWSDYPHVDFPHARRAPVVESEDEHAIHHHVYLYSLEWKNPFPNLKVSHMTITVDPNQSTTLGVLAVSVLKKGAD